MPSDAHRALRLRNGMVDLDSGSAVIDGKAVQLTTLERRFLVRVSMEPGKTVSVGTLLRDVWGVPETSQTRAMEALVRRLRRKLGENARCPQHLYTEHGEGFRFVSTPALATEEHPLVGRAGCLAEIRARVGAPHVVTLVGPAGVGKTALAKAALVGARFVDLSALGTEEDLVAELSRVSAEVEPSTPLILDNFEQLPNPCAIHVQELAQRVTVLVTSQRPLGVERELRIPVEPLDTEHTAELLSRCLSALGSTSTPSVVGEVAARLDGLPLEIELLAPLVALVGVDAVRTVDRLGVGSERVDVPPRHSSLRAALNRAWGLLEGDERRLLAALTVFHGSFDLRAAAHVSGRTEAEVLPLLGKLARYSWVHAGGGVSRLSGAVRSFAAQQEPNSVAAATELLTSYCAWLQVASGMEGGTLLERHREDLFVTLANSSGPHRLDIACAALDLASMRGGFDRLRKTLTRATANPEAPDWPDLYSLLATACRVRLPRHHPDFDQLNAILLGLHASGSATAYSYLSLMAGALQNGEDAAHWVEHGISAAREGPWRYRIRTMIPLVTQHPDDARVERELRDLLAEAEKRHLKEAVYETCAALAFLHLRTGQADRAVAVLSDLEHGGREDLLFARVTLVVSLLVSGQVERAVTELDSTIERLEGAVEDRADFLYVIRAAVRLGCGDPDGALESLPAGAPQRLHDLARTIRALATGQEVGPLTDPVLERLRQAWRAGDGLTHGRERLIQASVLRWLLDRTPANAQSRNM